VIAHLAQPATRRVFDLGLDAMWTSVREGVVDPRVASVRKTVENLPESDCDDSNVPTYDVMVALGVLAHALDTIIEDSGLAAISACTLAANYYGSYDVVLYEGSTRTRVIDPRNPPPVGPLKSRQVVLQLQLAEEAKSLPRSRAEVVQRIRASATGLASELEQSLPVYIERRFGASPPRIS